MRLAGIVGIGLCMVVSVAGCSDDELPAPPQYNNGGNGGVGGTGGGGQGGDVSTGLLAGEDCDPLVPTVCGMPFPSDVYTVADSRTPTGKRIKLTAKTMPEHNITGYLDPARFEQLDGFSVGQAALAHLPGATVTGLPTPLTIADSLLPDSLTVLIEAETGMPVPHFSELDMSSPLDEDRAFMVHPVVRLKDATRYIVAIRGVVDDTGTPLDPSEVFLALRDGSESTDPTVEPRRTLYEDIFAKLTAAGYETSDLQLAWDFTTSSLEEKTSWLLHMRDEALVTAGALGPEYTITDVIEDPNPFIRRRIKGLFTVPLYCDIAEAGAKLVFGDDGMPQQNGTAQYEFEVQIPHAATTGTPGAILQNGHGLLGKHTEGHDGYLAELAERHNFVTIAVDLVGFASDDEDIILDAINSDFLDFADVLERKHQGFINELLAMRMMKGRFVTEPQVQFNGMSAINPNEVYYRGDSQGGIYGATYMAITTDVTRGLLGEPGAPYNLLLNRSRDYTPFFLGLKIQFKKYLHTQMVISAAQMFWDRIDPITYLPHITLDPFPGTPTHNVLIHVAIGDQQVTPLAAHLMARELGAVHISPTHRAIWGLVEAPAPIMGNAMVEFKFPGVPENPIINVPPPQPEENDPHDWVRVLDAAYDQTNTFFRTGVVQQYCVDSCDPE
jgi:hypothetical protein